MTMAKKIVSLCLTLALIVTTFAVNTVDVKAEETRCTIILNDNYSNSEGIISGTFSTKKMGDYKIVLCYNGQDGPYSFCGENVSLDRDTEIPVNFGQNIGDYLGSLSNGGLAEITAKVYVGDTVVATSNAITVTLANERLTAPNAVINGNTITWDAVDGAASYELTLYRNEVVNGNTTLKSYKYGIKVNDCSYDFSSESEVAGIKVVACAGDYSQKLNSSSGVTKISSSTTPSNPATPSTDDSNSSNNSNLSFFSTLWSKLRNIFGL